MELEIENFTSTLKEKITWIKVGSQGPRVSYQNALTADEKGKAK